VVNTLATANSGTSHQEAAMNPIRAIRRPAHMLAVLVGAVLASYAAAPAALATPRPRPPAWNTHPSLPAHVHPLPIGGIPGWQLTLMAVTVVLLVATLVAIGYPGPGRPAAGERTHRPSDDASGVASNRGSSLSRRPGWPRPAETAEPIPGLEGTDHHERHSPGRASG
jgi:hypothetical protein